MSAPRRVTPARSTAWIAGYVDARKGIPREAYPFEFADEPLRSEWLDGHDYAHEFASRSPQD